MCGRNYLLLSPLHFVVVACDDGTAADIALDHHPALTDGFGAGTLRHCPAALHADSDGLQRDVAAGILVEQPA